MILPAQRQSWEDLFSSFQRWFDVCNPTNRWVVVVANHTSAVWPRYSLIIKLNYSNFQALEIISLFSCAELSIQRC